MKNFTRYLESLDHSKSTQKAYLRHVSLFLGWYSGEVVNCSKKDILTYLEHLKKKKNQENITRKNALIALNHYFAFLQANEEITSNPTALIKIRGTHKLHLYKTYTPEELQGIYDSYYHLFIRTFDDSHIPKNQRQQNFLSRQRNYIMLGMLVYQGLSTNELEKISLADVDPNKATLSVQGSKKSNPRKINLNASQIGALINYTDNVRPRLLAYQNNQDSQQLFLPLPESGQSSTQSQSIMGTLKSMSKQVKTIAPNFTNFKQIRASVISNWLKTEGLRKTQYMAGHRYIGSTEKYLPNNLNELTDDIAQFNPF